MARFNQAYVNNRNIEEELDAKLSKSGGTMTGNLVLENGLGIFGINANGEEQWALQVPNSNNNTVLGYGGYEKGLGATNIYGNDIVFTNKTTGVVYRSYGANNVLWSGGLYMTANQTATLSEAISAQPNGIALYFGYYSNSTVQPYDGKWLFVPKYIINSNGTGCDFSMLSEDGHMWKYLYIRDTVITGYTNNATAREIGGVSIRPELYVLHYVIGL